MSCWQCTKPWTGQVAGTLSLAVHPTSILGLLPAGGSAKTAAARHVSGQPGIADDDMYPLSMPRRGWLGGRPPSTHPINLDAERRVCRRALDAEPPCSPNDFFRLCLVSGGRCGGMARHTAKSIITLPNIQGLSGVSLNAALNMEYLIQKSHKSTGL